MNCVVCGFEIPPAAKYSIENNVCPACGKQIMNEDTLSLIKDIEKKIATEVKLCEKTSKKLAMLLVTNYNVRLCGELDCSDAVIVDAMIEHEEVIEKQIAEPVEKVKVAPPSVAQQVEDKESVSEGIIKAADLIDDIKRERIMAEVAAKRNNIVFANGVIDNDIEQEQEEDYSDIEYDSTDVPVGGKISSSIFTEGAESPILEQIRLAKKARDAKQGGTFRRGS